MDLQCTFFVAVLPKTWLLRDAVWGACGLTAKAETITWGWPQVFFPPHSESPHINKVAVLVKKSTYKPVIRNAIQFRHGVKNYCIHPLDGLLAPRYFLKPKENVKPGQDMYCCRREELRVARMVWRIAYPAKLQWRWPRLTHCSLHAFGFVHLLNCS